jgi:hypothetical protein
MDFSMLFTLDAERPPRAVGVHDLKVEITNGRAAGRNLTKFAQELSKADSRSMSLKEPFRETWHNINSTYWLLYNNPATASNNF